jgi:membrane protein required for colicin V production
MTTTDIIIVICIVGGTFIGLAKGLIWQAATILGLVVGFIVAKHLYPHLAEKISLITDSPTMVQIIAFIGIWLMVPIVFSLISALLTKIVDAASLGCFNRLLGGVLGMIKYIFFIGIIIHVFDYFDTENRLLSLEKKEASVLYYPLKEFASSVFPAIKEINGKTIFEQEDENTKRRA